MLRFLEGVIRVSTKSAFEVVDITGQVETWVETNNLENGILLTYIPHTTAALAVNENERGLKEDIINFLKELTKPEKGWKHNLVDVNAHAHLANIIVGNDRVIPIAKGKPALGTWQRILLIELEGPRERAVKLIYIGE
ncbi:MAG: secondary thiamine-phosphate synthase enzyme YjbQ [Thermoprotei archaeon]|nr:secondary thiamine-phosphate synthase enzyme YjbQ [Thermoprotei archaeon]